MDDIIFFGEQNAPTAVESFAQAQAALLDALEPQRLIMQSAGLQYMFSAAIPATLAADGETVVSPAVPAVVGTIQTRDPTDFRDISNITGLTAAAGIQVQRGVTDVAFGFRDEQNITHPMTPVQMQDMGIAVTNFISSTYAAKWRIQNEINALTPQTIGNFDITQGWTS